MREWGATEDEILATLAMPETTGHWLEAVEALQGFEALQNARFQARTVAPDISMPWDPRLNLAALGDVLARGALARRAARLARHPRRTAHRAIGEQIPPSPEAPLPATMEPGNDGTAMAVRGAGSFRGPIALAPAPQSMQAASLIQMRLTQQALGEMPMALIEARTLLAQGSWVLGVSVIIVALISFPDLQKFASLTSPKQIVPLVEGFGRMGLGTTPWGLFIGVVLIFGGMQRSLLRILCILSGAWILLFTRPLVDMVAFPNFDLSMAVWTGWVLIGLSLAYGPLFRYAGRGGSRFAGLRV
jgi:hypothetical protein